MIHLSTDFSEITECSFISCLAGQDAGGLEIYSITGGIDGINLPVKECMFICCAAHYDTGGPSTATGGGLLFNMNTHTFGISNTLFSKCKSKYNIGGSMVTINKNHFDHIIRFCFYSENTAPNGRNVLVVFNDTVGIPWDIVFLHSFTSDNTVTNSVVQNPSSASQVRLDWLPLGTLSYLNTWDGITYTYPESDPDNPTRLAQITHDYAETVSIKKTPLYFLSAHSSFIECVRSDNTLINQNSNTLAVCSERTYSDDNKCQHTTTRLSYQTGTPTFKYVDFISCSSSSNGGAISCTGTNTKLEFVRCSFKSCVSSSGFGGAIYADGISTFSIEKTLFFDCNSTTKRGGGLRFISNKCFPLLSDTSFISCYASMICDTSPGSYDDAGGLSIVSSLSSTVFHYVLQWCRFIACGCYGWGGGGEITVSSAVLGCKDCLFSSCKCIDAEGIGFSLETENANVLIHFCYFSCSTSSTPPTDISINRNAGSFTTPIFHSFTIKEPSISVKTCFKWGTRTNRNWFIQ